MKILYSVQATGNGHISRAHQLYPYLAEMGDVDILLSGSNATLELNLPITYRSRGLSLFYSECGDLNYRKIWNEFDYKQVVKDAKNLPVEKYDLIINDFDYVTARACKNKKVKSVHFGHQASFMSDKTPRPEKKSMVGEIILKNYANASHHVGLHFDKYDEFVFPPIIKREFIEATPSDQGHITIYLPAYETRCIEPMLKDLAPLPIHWFLPNVEKPYVDDNIHYFPVAQNYFNDSLIHCHGLVTGGGFETPAEALYLGKKLLTIPIGGQYEQQCNAAALEKMGVKKMDYLNEETFSRFIDWIYAKQHVQKVEANDIRKTLAYVINAN